MSEPREVQHEFLVRVKTKTPSDGEQVAERVEETHAHLREQVQKAAKGLIGADDSTVTDHGHW